MRMRKTMRKMMTMMTRRNNRMERKKEMCKARQQVSILTVIIHLVASQTFRCNRNAGNRKSSELELHSDAISHFVNLPDNVSARDHGNM